MALLPEVSASLTDDISEIDANGHFLQQVATALIFYTTEGRPAAAQEALILQTALETCRINPKVYEDFSNESLMYNIHTSINTVETSLLVFIMAYGDDCVIYDRKRKPLYIRDILSVMSEHRMNNKHKILVFESFCSSSDNFPLEATASPDFVITNQRGWRLEEPDTLVFSTVLYDNVPISRLLIVELASQIESAQKTDNIYAVLTRTLSAMRMLCTQAIIVNPSHTSSLTRPFYFKEFCTTIEEFISTMLDRGYPSKNRKLVWCSDGRF